MSETTETPKKSSKKLIIVLFLLAAGVIGYLKYTNGSIFSCGNAESKDSTAVDSVKVEAPVVDTTKVEVAPVASDSTKK